MMNASLHAIYILVPYITHLCQYTEPLYTFNEHNQIDNQI